MLLQTRNKTITTREKVTCRVIAHTQWIQKWSDFKLITISRAQKRRLMVAVMQNIIKSKEKEEDGSSSAT